MTTMLAVQIWTCAIAPAAVPETLLDPNVVRTWDIVVADGATEAEKHAAKEFRSLFKQVSGAELPTSGAAGAKPGHVLIGPDVVKSGPGDLGEEGLHIRIAADRIEITGGRPRGTLYGVYEFFEKYLGVRFLTFDHTHVSPLTAGTRLPIGEHTYRPPLIFRYSYYRANQAHHDFATRKRVNTVAGEAHLGGMCSQRLINHTLLRQIPSSKYGKEHPEYYCLRNGKRLNKVRSDAYDNEPCLTNPDVLDIVTQAVLDEIEKNPTRKNFSVSQNDNDKYCQCEKCAALDKREGTPMGSLLTFVNAVAERVEAKHPDVLIGTLAYWYTRQAPKTIRPRHNVQIQLCSIECCTLHPINDPNCSKNVKFARDVDAWRKLTDRIWIWNYNTNFARYDLPHPNLRVIGPNVRYFVRSHAKGIFMQANANSLAGEMSDLRNYIISGMLWNPSKSGEALRNEFIDLHYGAAAPAIRLYLDRLHDNAEAKGCHPGTFPRADDVGVDPNMAAQGMDLFRHAMALAEDDTVKARVEKASICMYRGMLEGGATHRFADDRLLPTFPDRFGDVVSDYIVLTKKHNMTRVSEGGVVGPYYDEIRAGAKGHPTVRVENDVWQMTLLPEKNGMIVELFHKPSKRHLLDGVQSHRITFGSDKGIDERASRGYGHDKPWAFKAQVSGTKVHLTKAIPHGATLERTIELATDAPEQIRFKTVFTHKGKPGHEYKFAARFDVREPLDLSSAGRVEAYVETDRWQPVPGNWREEKSDAHPLLKDPVARAVALFNHDAKAGLAIRFDPAGTERVILRVESERRRPDTQLLTKDFKLDPDQRFEYAYTMTFLTEAPK